MVYRFYCMALFHSQTRRHMINHCYNLTSPFIQWYYPIWIFMKTHKAFKEFPSGHEAITSCWRHYDPNFNLALFSVVSLTEVFYFTARLSKTCLQPINCSFIASKTTWHVSNTRTCIKNSKRSISVLCR